MPTPAETEWLVLPDVHLPINDMAILQAAIAAGAIHLLRGDRHFGPYRGQWIQGVLILKPSAYRPGGLVDR